jgi:hypothetical protein
LDLRVGQTHLRLGLAAAKPETRQLLDSALGLLEAGLASRGLTLEAAPARTLLPVAKPEAAAEPRGVVDLRA